MTDQAKYRIRKLFGWMAMFGALAITIATGYRAHQNTMRDTAVLRQQQNITSAITENETDPVAMLNDQGKVVLWNDAIADLTGYSFDEIKKGGLRQLMCTADEEAKHSDGLAEAFKFPAKHRKLAVVNCRIKTKDGSLVPVRISIRMLRSFDGENYASAHVDKQSQVVEFGTPPPELKRVIPAK